MHRYRDPVERLHRKRLENWQNGYPDINSDPELKSAYHSLNLYWLHRSPEYREIIRQRVNEAAKRAEKLSQRIDRYHQNIDYLGREIDGCG